MKAKPSGQIVASVLAVQGIRNAVVSPGSRNTPFILALDDEPGVRCHVVIDERSAAFIALGMAQVSRKPVLLCCTSGTALLNYAPAVAEAYYQGVPLIIVSADRPSEWIDQDDSQTLRQFEGLRNFVKASFDLPDFDIASEDLCWFANRTANDAFLTAVSGRPGPVHINMHFADPLSARHSAVGAQRIITAPDMACTLSPRVMKELAKEASTKKILIVAGANFPSNRINRAVTVLSHLPNVAVWAESIANIHTPDIINCIDRTLLAIDQADAAYKPDLVISFGGALVSRMAKAYLRKLSHVEHWSIAYRRDRLADPFMHLSKVIETSPEVFLPHFANALCRCRPSGNYADTWKEAAAAAATRHTAKVSKAQWSALRAFNYILPRIPAKMNLQLSNGTAIRYAQLIDSCRVHASYCNRGVSGIDGSTSTAIGAASVYSHPTVLISGDMSFAYDIGALASSCISTDFRIMVINNGGGEIFRFIRTTSALAQREHYFSVNPLLPLRELAEAYDFDYYRVDSEQSLKSQLNSFFAPSLSPAIMEIIVDADISAGILTEYFK